MRAMFVFALTIFTGAFLLFQVQPIIAKYILPWFGGSPGVWTTCMLFFQVLLLGGYAYAHFTSRWLKPRIQAVLHVALLAGALAMLPVIPSDAWKPGENQEPVLRILSLLTVSLGLPYFVLSSTGPLMQQWFSRTNPGVSPYRLYALSNAGSLLALVSYPFLFEPELTRKAQASMWGWGLVVFAVCCLVCAVKLFRVPAELARPATGEKAASPSIETRTGPAIQAGTYVLWLLLPACASLLLLATTNKMCQDVAVMPFLWVLPLSIYLVTFILSFDSPRWYQRLPFPLMLVGALAAVYWAIPRGGETPLVLLLVVYSVVLFICCMVCHGELYRLKPDPAHLTGFYLMIAAGGALGGGLVAVVAPVVFTDYYELHWGVILCGVLFLATCARDRSESRARECRWMAWVLPLVVMVGLDRVLSGLAGDSNEVLEGCLVGLRVCEGILLFLAIYLGLERRTFAKGSAGWGAKLVLILVPWVARKHLTGYAMWPRLACWWMAVGLAVLGFGLRCEARRNANLVAERVRNFYGVLTVIEAARENPLAHHRSLVHGQVLMGSQFLDPVRATWPTVYYGRGGAAGLAIQAMSKNGRRIGLVGLGVGTMAAYGRTNDYFRCYEINPVAVRMARTDFTYLSTCEAKAKVEFTLGDARLSLERELPQRFDLLVVDAFAGDSPPVHLLTKEAFAVYERHLATNGVIAVHISNRYLDFEPVIANAARELGLHFAILDGKPDAVEMEQASPGQPWWITPSVWGLLTHDQGLLATPAIRAASRPPDRSPDKIRPWTDDYTSLFHVMR